MRVAFLLLTFGILSGCAGRSFEVEGDVVLDGNPADEGSISFVPADGKGPDFGGVIAAGHYKISSPPGLEPGKRIVRIRANKKTGKRIPAGPPLPPETMIDEVVRAHASFHDSDKLTADLSFDRPNRFDFKLSSAPPK